MQSARTTPNSKPKECQEAALARPHRLSRSRELLLNPQTSPTVSSQLKNHVSAFGQPGWRASLVRTVLGSLFRL